MANKLYVGSLPYSTTDDQLKEFFSQAGEVLSATVITDKMSGRSKGFGFVEMTTPEGFQKALELNGQPMDGRNLVVNEARPMQPRAPRTGGFGGGGGGRGGFGGGRRDY